MFNLNLLFMKRKMYTLFTVLILLISIPAFAEKTVVVVEPDEGLEIGALNTAINNAADPGNTIFELKRGGLYLLNGSISHTGYTLHIRAEAGTGARPILQPGVDDLGVSSNHFDPAGSIILEGLYITGIDELGVTKGNLIYVTGADSRIIIDDCVFDYDTSADVYLSSIDNTVIITNCVHRNLTQPANPSNGRVVDTRGNPQDTIIIENSTMYHVSAKTVSGPDYIGYMRFNHNTNFCCNWTSVFALGNVIDCEVTNNIFYNYAMRGLRNYPNNTLFTIDSLGTITVGETVISDADKNFDMRNNNFYQEPQYMQYILDYTPDPVYLEDVEYTFALEDIEQTDTIWYTSYKIRDELFTQPIYDTIVFKEWKSWPEITLAQNFVNNGQVDTTGFIREALVFKNPPPFFGDYWKFFIENGWSIKGTNPPNAFADEDLLTIGEVTEGAFDFSYNDNSVSATGAIDGGPMGDPRWVPYSTVSTQNVKASPSATVRTYPNPFSEAVNFEITAKENSSVKIIVFDLTGKEIFRINEKVNQGVNIVTVNLNSLSHSGVYLYQIQTELSAGQKNIASGKLIKR